MISIVMPYWRRPEILAESLEHYASLYGSNDINEIIIVDDGSPEPAEAEGDYPFPVRVVRLPAKTEAKNPCVPFNAGVRLATSKIIVLTNPEIFHAKNILQQMACRTEKLGEKGYVAASCWSDQHATWLCHTDVPHVPGRAKLPNGAGLHFCAAIHRSFYEGIGGFSEAYREGQGYEDNDFLFRLESAGAAFAIANDLVVEHRQCPPTKWPRGGADRNRRIFEAKWGK